jgi:hypothetical protein
MLLGFVTVRWSRIAVFSGAVVALVVYTLIALAFFGRTLMWVPIVLPVGLALFTVLYRLLTPGVEKPRQLG